MKQQYIKPTIEKHTLAFEPDTLAMSGNSETGNCHCGCPSSCCSSNADCKGNGKDGCNHKLAPIPDSFEPINWDF